MKKIMIVLFLLVGVGTTALAQKTPSVKPTVEKLIILDKYEKNVLIKVPEGRFNQPSVPVRLYPVLDRILNRFGCTNCGGLTRYEKLVVVKALLSAGLLTEEEILQIAEGLGIQLPPKS